jgi:hypothetical protein
MVMLDPLQDAGSERPQELYIIGEECQADWKHPESQDRQEPKNAANRQQQPHRKPKPSTGWLPERVND